MKDPVRVVVADDHPMIRYGIHKILEASPDLEVVAEAATGQELVDVVDRTCPDVAVVDLEMPEVDGLEAIRRIRDRHPQVRCLILTAHEEAAYVQRAAVAGASGYLLKRDTATQLISGIIAVAEGKAALHPNVTHYLVHQIAGLPDATRAEEPLSPREHEVLQLMANGRNTKQIAAQLGIGVQTVKTHIAHIYRRMGAKDRIDAVASAIRKGLVR